MADDRPPAVPVSARLDPELVVRIDKDRAERRWSRSQWIAWACEVALRSPEGSDV